jgi:hypothetical protein
MDLFPALFHNASDQIRNSLAICERQELPVHKNKRFINPSAAKQALKTCYRDLGDHRVHRIQN